MNTPRSRWSDRDAAVRHRAEMEEMEIRAGFEQALMDAEARHGRMHPEVLGPLAALARLLHATGHVHDALPLLERAVEIQEQAFGNDQAGLADLLRDLGMAKALTHPAEARPLLERAFAITEAIRGPDDPVIAVHLCGLGMVLYDLGQPGEARPLLERALARHEHTHGSTSLQVGGILSNLALVLKALGAVEEAESAGARALAIAEQHQDIRDEGMGTGTGTGGAQ